MYSYRDFCLLIKESLLSTTELNKSVDIFERDFRMLKNSYNIIKYPEKKSFAIIISGYLEEEKLKHIIRLGNNLGYYPIGFNAKKNNMKNFFPWVDIEYFYSKVKKNIQEFIIFFDAIFDDQIIGIKKLYHTTNLVHLDKIMKIGLCPKNDNRKVHHPERIYFCYNLKDIEKMAKQLKANDLFNNLKESVYIILEVDSTKIQKIYKDPQSNGCYTYENIHPKYIKNTEIIY